MNMTDWAKNEIKLACKIENPNWDGESFDYGCSCYMSALKAFESLCEDGHSGFSIHITKRILNRLIGGKPLIPITDEDFYEDEDSIKESKTSLKRRGLKSSIQCPRMSSLFRDESEDGTVRYYDVDRIKCVDIVTGSTFHYSEANKIVDELYPITMPYMPADKPYEVYMEQFLSNKNDKHNDWDTEAIWYIKTPTAEKKPINKCYKFVNEERIEITKEEFAERRIEITEKEHKERLKEYMLAKNTEPIVEIEH